ncbi:unnamed protein product [Calypogeia fissa]
MYGYQRFLEDAAEATADFARKARIKVEIPPAQFCIDGTVAAKGPCNLGSRLFARFMCCCNAWRRSPNVYPEAKKRAAPPRGWKTAPFILGSEIGERLGSTTITYNLMVYLMTQLKFPLVKAVYISTASFGASNLAPLLGEFLSDAYLGRFTAVAAGSIFYLGGLVLLTMLVMTSNLRPSNCNGEDQCHQSTSLQMAVLFLSLTLQTAGSACIRPCAAPFGADQFDETNSAHQSQIHNFFNWYKACMATTMVVAVTVIVWIQTDFEWGWGSLVLCIIMGLALMALLFLSSWYRSVAAIGSPLTGLMRVLVAAIRKRKLSLPPDPDFLYQVKTYGINNDLLGHTEKMRWLDKAAILEDYKDDAMSQSVCDPWSLCAVHQVEELKKILAMTPIWLCASVSSIVYIQVFTVMTKQTLTMDMSVGDHMHFPAASMGVFSILTFFLFVPLYDAYLIGLLRKLTGNLRGLTSLQRIGTGIFIGILTMSVSSILENRRRALIIYHTGDNQQLSGFCLVPQFVLAGLGESFMVPGLLEFFYDETPSRLQSMHKTFVWAALGMGGFLSATLVSILQAITKTAAGEANVWLHDDINRGRVDYFYCTLAVIGILVFTFYIFVASAYTYSVKSDLQSEHIKFYKSGTDTIDDSL